MPGMPLSVMCYERADDVAAGVSGVVTRARGIRASFPELKPEDIPMAVAVQQERVFYLLDPLRASRRPLPLRFLDAVLRKFGKLAGVKNHSVELPWTPGFLHKSGGLVMSIGQFNQWVASQLMTNGLVQIWPGTPVSEPLIEGSSVKGLRLADQGVDKNGEPSAGFMAGMNVQARLTVVGDGPVGAVGRVIDERLGMPKGNERNEWALGMKFLIELPEGCESPLDPGTVWHTIGYPEPEIFGFLYTSSNDG